MKFSEKRKAQLGLKSLGDMIRSGEVKTQKDPSLFVHAHPDVDCLEDKLSKLEVLGVIAPSGGGKTEWTLNQMMYILENNPEEIGIFVSLEMASQKIAQRMNRITGGNLDILDRFYIISNFDDNGKAKMLTTDGILAEAKMYKEGLGSEVCVMAIDHLHILQPTQKQGQDLNKIAQSVKDLAMELKTFIILLSQTTKGKSGSYGDKMLDKDASFNCSQFVWIASYIITLHQPLARVQSSFKLPILAWAYMKVREKSVNDKVQVGEFQLQYYEMETGRLRKLTPSEMITFSTAYHQVLEMIKEEEDNNGGAIYNTKIDGKGLTDRERLLGDTYVPVEKPETDEDYEKRTSFRKFRKDKQ